MLEEISDYAEILTKNTPLLDVRAPVEFEKGSFPNARNFPILNNDERAKIGKHYKNHGNNAATSLGHQLVSGELKSTRVHAWQHYIAQHPDTVLYCFRGGQRSKISQTWLSDVGVDIPRVTGGYKAMRQFLIKSLDQIAESHQAIVIGGKTGTGKTLAIKALGNGLDLEHIANHRGSSFGRHVIEQPTQINFENTLAIELLKLSLKHPKFYIIEDESRCIGRLTIPKNFYENANKGPVVIIDEPLESRIEVIKQDYIISMQREFAEAYSDSTVAFDHFSQHLLAALQRISKRLGGLRYQQLLVIMKEALNEHQLTGNPASHSAWIGPLLQEYYDPMYDYQLEKKRHRIIKSGSRNEIIDYLITQQSN